MIKIKLSLMKKPGRQVASIAGNQGCSSLLLMKISEILNHDFFQYFQPAPDLPGRHKLEKQKLKEQVRQLRRENALLKGNR